MSTCIQIIDGMVPGINRLVARSDRCPFWGTTIFGNTLIETKNCIKQWFESWLCFLKGTLMSYLEGWKIEVITSFAKESLFLCNSFEAFCYGFLMVFGILRWRWVSVLLIDSQPWWLFLTRGTERADGTVRSGDVRSFERLHHIEMEFSPTCGGDGMWWWKFSPFGFFTKLPWSKRWNGTFKNGPKGRGRCENRGGCVKPARWTWCTWATDKILKKSHPRFPRWWKQRSETTGIMRAGLEGWVEKKFQQKCQRGRFVVVEMTNTSKTGY